MERLRVENICKTYEMDSALSSFVRCFFSVDKGEFVAIIGASGSGKVYPVAHWWWC